MNEQGTIGDLIKDLRDQTAALLREEVALAKTEMGEKASKATRNVGFIAGGLLVGYSGVVLLLLGFGWLLARAFVEAGMSQTMSVFLGLAIVAVTVLIIAAILVAKGRSSLQKQSFTPEKTVQSLREDKNWAKSKVAR